MGKRSINMLNVSLHTPFDSSTVVDIDIGMWLINHYPRIGNLFALENCKGCSMLKRIDSYCKCDYGQKSMEQANKILVKDTTNAE